MFTFKDFKTVFEILSFYTILPISMNFEENSIFVSLGFNLLRIFITITC